MENIICSIVSCNLSAQTDPDKHFFPAPSDYATKTLWIYATGKNLSHSSEFFICEDHFDVSFTRLNCYSINFKFFAFRFIALQRC